MWSLQFTRPTLNYQHSTLYSSRQIKPLSHVKGTNTKDYLSQYPASHRCHKNNLVSKWVIPHKCTVTRNQQSHLFPHPWWYYTMLAYYRSMKQEKYWSVYNTASSPNTTLRSHLAHSHYHVYNTNATGPYPGSCESSPHPHALSASFTKVHQVASSLKNFWSKLCVYFSSFPHSILLFHLDTATAHLGTQASYSQDLS
jgi:hypothetical protein